ncbi:hypothetical protein D7I39_11310 [Allopusillimonas ginsengisoli]|nr:hypothetical protein D7I39_11310 [Allopusillimonas ginsengisoli]
MSEINEILDDSRQSAGSITVDDKEQEYHIVGYKNVLVQVPCADLIGAERRCAALERLIRKDVPGDTILAFIDRAKHDGRWI